MKTDLKNKIQEADALFADKNKDDYVLPEYNKDTYSLDIAKAGYYQALVVLRHFIKLASDVYWGEMQAAYNVDLFMLTSSVSSPMGPGSDSEAVRLKLGELDTFLVDSSQFGFEPILLNNIKKLYCYLPSMRGEDPNKRHLNQFFHCEAEIVGELKDLRPQIEGYVKFLSETLLLMPNILDLLTTNSKVSFKKLNDLSKADKLKEISLDEAIKLLEDAGFGEFVNKTEHGSDVTSRGELKLMELLKTGTPIWIKSFDRDRVPFYQSPDSNNENKAINADLLFPAIVDSSFGGEIVGSGQRQNNPEEMYESLRRQGLDSKPYEWYINLRRLPNYKTTSGFGLGVERFIAWALCRDDIKDVILYPRLKNVLSYP
ncbi:MAG TPA: amino acid--tRNA ligase-related protein [Patescibacteria group bacterium]